MGEPDKAVQAYSALHRLRQRNSDTFGPDIPLNHLTVYKGFRDLVDGLVYAVERDWDRQLKREGLLR